MKAQFSIAWKLLPVLSIVSLLVVGLALAFPPQSAAASGLDQESVPSGEARPLDPARLKRLYQRALRLLDVQAALLERMEERTVGYQERKNNFAADGKDVTALQEALNQFNGDLIVARDLHSKAEDMLADHAGFNEEGKVTDSHQAVGTLRESGKIMRELHRDLRAMPRLLVKAMRQFIRDNRPQD